jgi:polyketide biosynthesis enoyl-CoA hydratase PksI
MSEWVSTVAAASPEGAPPPDVRLIDLEDGIVELAMRDVPGGNAMTASWVSSLLTAYAAITAHATARVVLLTGLPDVFCSGASRETLADLVAGRLEPTELTLGRRLLELPLPVVAAAEGHAIGGGFALLVSCDLAVLARESRYGANFTALGITPGMGMTRLLEQVVPPALARELLLVGDLRRGAAFEGTGSFNGVVPRAEVRARALILARALGEKPRDTLVHLKRNLALPRLRAFDDAAPLEAKMHAETLKHLDLGAWGAS